MDRQGSTTERFYKLIWPHAPMVLRTALFLTRQAAEADDLAQETLLKAFRSLSQFRDGTDAKAWLMTILRNTRIDRIRAKASHPATLSLDEMVQEPPHPDLETSQPDANWTDPRQMMEQLGDQQIIDALQGLPEDIRWTLLLVDVEGIDHADAAEVLGIPVGTVKSRVHRGHRMLRDVLRPAATNLKSSGKEDSRGAL